MTISCLTCCHACPSLSKYFSHQWVHRHTPNITFPCPFPSCGMVLSRYKNLCAHKRSHARQPLRFIASTQSGHFTKCTSAGCTFRAESLSILLNHLESHARKGQNVVCICKNKEWTNFSSFSSHFRRSHLKSSAFTIRNLESASSTCDVFESSSESRHMDVDPVFPVPGPGPEIEMNDDISPDISDDDFIKSFAMMLLRLQSKSFLSVTTLQFVTEAIRGINDHATDYQRKKFRDLADKYKIEPNVRTAIEDEIFNNSLHEMAVGDKGVFRSNHMRKKFYREHFDLLEPVQYELSNGVEKHKYHYVPVKESLATLLRDKSVQKLYNKKGESKANILRDFEDGTAFKSIKFFHEHPNGMKIILYLDAFEPCEALKAARGKHKILAVYMSLGNMPSYCRSLRDPIQLVMLVKEDTLKKFSYEEVFAPLLQDLQSLYDEGINVTFEDVPQTIRGCVVGVSADNLEAHTLGGFNQGFSKAHYYCRFCYAKRSARLRGDVSVCIERTCLNYDRDATEADEKDGSVRGVWESSIFNAFPEFHVINGLPPCSAHDVAEGFLPKDLFLALKALVKDGWFTWNYINAKIKFINGIKPSGSIREIKPTKKKIVGSASSNFHLLQIITIALVDRVTDPNHPAWQMIVTLQELVAIVSAPEISIEQTFHIDLLGERYISLRKELFPNVTLKCKHHYILHYGALTRKFGPLQRWSTIRFEAKHQYFKLAGKASRNFINPTFSLSVRHQYLQAYLQEGNLFPTVVQANSVSPFQRQLFSQEFLGVLDSFGHASSSLFTASKAEHHGISYSVGDIVMVKPNDDKSITTVKIDIIIICNNFTNLIFIGSEKLIKYHQYFGIYQLISKNALISCSSDQLASPDPLVEICIGDLSFTFLKHAVMIEF